MARENVLQGSGVSRINLDDGALGHRDCTLTLIPKSHNGALTHSLVLPGRQDCGPGQQLIANCGPQIIDLVLRSHGIPQHGAASIGQCVVRQVTENAAMDKAVLLLQIVPYSQ